MWKHLVLAAFLAALPAAAAVADTAAPGRWQTIGFKDVGRGVDRDSISLPGQRRFAQIRLCAVRHPIRLHDFTVRFANDNYQRLPVRRFLEPNHCTRPLDFYGRRHNVDRIWLTYERIGGVGGTPVIYVQAR